MGERGGNKDFKEFLSCAQKGVWNLSVLCTYIAGLYIILKQQARRFNVLQVVGV